MNPADRLPGAAGYAALFGVALAARLSLDLLPVQYITAGQEKVWSWAFFGVFSLCFLLGALLANRARLPAPAETLSGPALGWALPLAVGGAVGLLTIGSDLLHPAAAARGLSTLHVRGPAAIPFYLYGALLLTAVFHFFPMAFAAWVARRLRDPWRLAVVSIALAAVALSEDLGFFLRASSLATVEAGRHVLSVLANGTEAFFIYRFGLVSGLLQRGSTYVLWHLAWPLMGPE